MRKFAVYLDEASLRDLQRLSAERKCTRAAIVREAIGAYLRRCRRPPAKGIGMYSSGRSDISERAEELLWHAARVRVSRRNERVN